MKEIQLTQGKIALVDDEDYERLILWKWKADKGSRSFYATRSEYKEGKKKTLMMHRVIMREPDGMEIDHIDGNGLNNQKHNLRVCTRKENSRNLPSTNKNGYKGVHKSGSKWMAQIWNDGTAVYLGTFLEVEEAARAYDEKAKEIFGDFARTNFD